MKKKILLILFLIIILMSNLSFASYSTVSMTVVEEPVCAIEIGDNSKFEKKLIGKDLTNKEVTLQLQVTNQEVPNKLTGEVMIVIDNSDSMTDEISGTTRKDLVFESAKTLVSNLLQDNTALNVGIVSFSSNSDTSKEGTLEDAFLISEMSNDVTTLTNAISNIQTNGARTDLDAGIQLATQYFTDNSTNKYMIVLTDGVPNIAVNYDKNYYSDDVIAKTKQTLLNTTNNGIQLFTMLTGIVDENYVPLGNKSYGQIISEIFGSTETPTTGKFYYVTDDKIEETITNTIYEDLIPKEKTFKDFTIVDYFPQEIINNFDFAYVSNATHGNISTQVDTTNNSITWTIPELSAGETATVQYKLKLKENFDSSIINQILDTNEKVDISYTDPNGDIQEKTSDVTPKLKLTEPPAVLPAAGKTILIAFIVLATGLLVFSLIKLTVLNKKMN